MKTIVFCLQTMVRGGVEKELLTVLRKMDPSQFQVTVALMYIDNREIINEIPGWVRLINLDIDKGYYCCRTLQMAKARLRAGYVEEAIKLPVKRLLRQGISHSNQSIERIPALEERYDTAVCYHIHSPLTLKYVTEKVNAGKKIGWIHNDFFSTGYPIQRINDILSKYDEFIAVSKTVMREFQMLCPAQAEKVSVLYNALDEEDIREKAKLLPESDPFFFDKRVKILTVGRFTEQKGFDIAAEICRRMQNTGLLFCWYFLGWGPEEAKLKHFITANRLEDCVDILGERKNPYPYIDCCDLYVQPSRHEAWGLAVQEARILHKPIVCTDFAGSDEQIVNGLTGYIVPLGQGISALESRIIHLVEDEAERNRLSANLAKQQGTNEDMAKIISKLEE